MFRYSLSETKQMFFNHLKSDFILLSDPYKIRQIHYELEFVKM